MEEMCFASIGSAFTGIINNYHKAIYKTHRKDYLAKLL